MAGLLTDIDAFCEAHGMSASKFGELSMNDKCFVHELRNEAKPRRVWPETEARVRKFMVTYRPDTQDAAA